MCLLSAARLPPALRCLSVLVRRVKGGWWSFGPCPCSWGLSLSFRPLSCHGDPNRVGWALSVSPGLLGLPVRLACHLRRSGLPLVIWALSSSLVRPMVMVGAVGPLGGYAVGVLRGSVIELIKLVKEKARTEKDIH